MPRVTSSTPTAARRGASRPSTAWREPRSAGDSSIRGDGLFVAGTFLEADGDRSIRQFARWRADAWASLGRVVGFVDGRFALTLRTDRGLTYGIEASDDLRAWTRLVTFTNLTEAVRFVDEQSASEPRRFYRAVSP